MVQVFEPLNDMLEMTPLPVGEVHVMPFQLFVIALMVGDTAAVWLYEKVVVAIVKAVFG